MYELRSYERGRAFSDSAKHGDELPEGAFVAAAGQQHLERVRCETCSSFNQCNDAQRRYGKPAQRARDDERDRDAQERVDREAAFEWTAQPKSGTDDVLVDRQLFGSLHRPERYHLQDENER
jgi:hypothetical protein